MNSYSIEKSTVTNIKILMQTVFIVFCLIYTQSMDATIEYPTYPTPGFHNVEKICKDILLDIDALSFNGDLKDAWIDQSDYLLNQFLVLGRAIDDLVTNKEECRAYLLEDLHYLHEIMVLVESSCSAILNKKIRNTVYTTMQTIVEESKIKLDSLYNLNQEIILS
jgi:hypothetical protein